MKPLLRPCPICSCPDGKHLTTIELASVFDDPLPKTFDVCLCSCCGLCFDDLPASQADFDSFYEASSKYAAANTGGSGGCSAADLRRWENVIDILSPHLKTAHRIVDIGCGKGGLLLALRARGFQNLVGIEPSSGCRHALAEQNIVC